MVALSGGVNETVMAQQAQPVTVHYPKRTNIAGYVFDAFFRMDHQSELEITKHPVQTGANIADHSYRQPRRIQFEIGMTDVAKDIIQGQFNSGSSRAITAYKILDDLQKSRMPVQVTTRLDIFENMLIKSISIPDDHTTLYGLKATVIMEEVLLSSIKNYKISAMPDKTNIAPRGTVAPKPVDKNSVIAKKIKNIAHTANVNTKAYIEYNYGSIK